MSVSCTCGSSSWSSSNIAELHKRYVEGEIRKHGYTPLHGPVITCMLRAMQAYPLSSVISPTLSVLLYYTVVSSWRGCAYALFTLS